MTLQSSGAISLSQIQSEFGGSNPISLSEYYRNGSYVTSNNTSVPTSGTIDLADFYGGVKAFFYTFSANAQEVDLESTLTTAGWNGTDPAIVTVNSGVYLWSDDTSTAALTISTALTGLCTIYNYGYIIGKGGQGGYRSTNATAGGPAIYNSGTSGIIVTNMADAYIAGGGGGGAGSPDSGSDDAGHGGGGAGGGRGGGQLSGRLGGSGGAVGQAGANGGSSYSVGQAKGGGAGGGGGGATDINSGGGGGGGRILPGTGGAGGNSTYDGGAGGSAGNAGSNQATIYGGGGGGGWGAAGGNAGSRIGGAGGAAISGTAISVTNNGTIYGSQA